MGRMVRVAMLSAWLGTLSYLVISSSCVLADGKLLRGQRWQRFTVEDSEADFFVAPNGDDRWSGKLPAPNSTATDGPFATIARAQQAVRELKKHAYLPKTEPVEKRWIGSPHQFGQGKDIVVLIRGGYYSLDKPLTFASEDGGERVETNLPSGAFEYHKLKDYYVTYAAYPGEQPIISGGVPVHNWTRTGDVWSTSVAGRTVQMLLANGVKQTLARTPNSGYFIPPAYSRTDHELAFRTGELESWPGMETNRVVMLLRWHTGVNSFTTIDEAKHIAYLSKPQSGILIVPPRFFVENVAALLDAPGEWFFDQRGGRLSLICPPWLTDPNQARMVVPSVERLIVIEGSPDKPVRNLRLYGLGIEAVNPGAHAVGFKYAHSCELVDCDLQGIGGTGIAVAAGCYQTRVLHNRFRTIDQGAIAVSGAAHPARWMDIIRQTIISYNRMDDCGGTNIAAHNTLHTTISHNEISNTRGRYAVSVGGWRNLEEAIDGGYRVEYNHLHQVQKDADDSGAIKTAGLTHDSVVRRNLIHDVRAGYFNDNVGFWFDNMSSGWLTEENIYYNLEQGDMKLCAANLVDNTYRNCFVIEPPEHAPEGIIEGKPAFRFDQLQITSGDEPSSEFVPTGALIEISARVLNMGATGILPVELYLDGRAVASQLFPVVRGNTRTVRFQWRCKKAGQHELAIGSTPFQSITVRGKDLETDYANLTVSHAVIPLGDAAHISAVVDNLTGAMQHVEVPLYVDGLIEQTKTIQLNANSSQTVSFALVADVGQHTVRVGNSLEVTIKVYPHTAVNVTQAELATHCSSTAQPHEIDVDQQNNRYRILAGGSDFYHGEDSYAAVYLQTKVTGNFVATVKVTGFGNRTHEWFRAGLFARNEMADSFSTEPGSPGSVLMFATPGRAGLQFDEFGDGCMHKADTQNLPEGVEFPIWLKMVRHGDSFSGYVSFDGRTWQCEKQTRPLPGLADSVDLGLAAGSCDNEAYWVKFEDFQLRVEQVRDAATRLGSQGTTRSVASVNAAGPTAPAQ